MTIHKSEGGATVDPMQKHRWEGSSLHGGLVGSEQRRSSLEPEA